MTEGISRINTVRTKIPPKDSGDREKRPGMTAMMKSKARISPPIMPRWSRLTGLATRQTIKNPTMVTSSAVMVEISLLLIWKACWKRSTKMMINKSVNAAGRARTMALRRNFPLTKFSLGSRARIREGIPMESRLISVSCDGERG